MAWVAKVHSGAYSLVIYGARQALLCYWCDAGAGMLVLRYPAQTGWILDATVNTSWYRYNKLIPLSFVYGRCQSIPSMETFNFTGHVMTVLPSADLVSGNST